MKIKQKNYPYSDKLLAKISSLNAKGFTLEDSYSNVLVLTDFLNDCKEFGGLFIIYKDKSIIGFLMWQFTGDGIHTVRRYIDQNYRGLGLGSKLTKRVIKLANKWGFKYKTYAAHYNLASINSSIKCGCIVSKITKKWIHLEAGFNILGDT